MKPNNIYVNFKQKYKKLNYLIHILFSYLLIYFQNIQQNFLNIQSYFFRVDWFYSLLQITSFPDPFNRFYDSPKLKYLQFLPVAN